MINKIFTIILVGLLFTACAPNNDDKPSAQVPPAEIQKPLPAECLQQLPLSLSWKQDPRAYQYEVHIGLQQGDYYETTILNGLVRSPSESLMLERGLTYHVRVVKKQTEFSGYLFKDFNFFIPTCNDRASWKSTHPKYEEPPQYFIDWNNLN